MNAALTIVEKLKDPDTREKIMEISLALLKACDALLMLGESPGANRERDQ